MKIRKSAAIILSILFFVTAAPSQPVFAGNAEETPGCQLQTILIDNGGNQIADRIGIGLRRSQHRRQMRHCGCGAPAKVSADD